MKSKKLHNISRLIDYKISMSILGEISLITGIGVFKRPPYYDLSPSCPECIDAIKSNCMDHNKLCYKGEIYVSYYEINHSFRKFEYLSLYLNKVLYMSIVNGIKRK